MRQLAKRMGYLARLEAFGGAVTVDTCILTTPMLPRRVRTIMTNSAKYAYYAPGLLGTRVVCGSLRDCVESAASGRVTLSEEPWKG